MHTLVLMIVRTNSKTLMLNKVKSFLKKYKGEAYNSYRIGGRWEKLLPRKNFNGKLYPICPLPLCIDIIKNHAITPEQLRKDLQKICGWIDDDGISCSKLDMGINGNNLEDVGRVYQQKFCFRTHIFNLETYDYSIPENSGDFSVVVVDMHW